MQRRLPPSSARYRYEVGADGSVHRVGHELRVQEECHYRVGDDRIGDAFGANLPSPLADLVDVAMAVYAVDRLSPRAPHRGDRHHTHWPRQLDVQLPLRNPDRWAAPALERPLRAALAFTTGDDWRFTFVPRPDLRRRAEAQAALFPNPPRDPVTAALFSGGLDSLAGLCRELAGADRRSFVLVSACTNSRTSAVQRSISRDLRNWFGLEIIPVVVPLGLRRFGRPYNDDERTQRSRGFLFTALGAVVALVAGATGLAVYENGVGAINLPYSGAQVGAQSSRNVHPVALDLMSQVVKLATGRPFTFRTPCIFLTKGQLCAELRVLGVGHLAGKTVSCDGFPRRVAGRVQCGLCTSCLLRRQALAVAGLSADDDPAGYSEDILRPRSGLAASALLPARAMLDQVAHLRLALSNGDPWSALAQAYPALLEVAAVLGTEGGDPDAALVALYRRYCEEWACFSPPLPGWSCWQAA